MAASAPASVTREVPAALRAALEELLGPGGLKGADALKTLDPGMHRANLDATLMARPSSPLETARVLALCARAGVGVVPQGGRTGIAGGAESHPGELIVSLDRLDRIVHIDPAGRTATVEAGVTLGRLEEALAPHALSVGIDLGARDSATVGGMVATNAGGIEAFRHGTMRERVLGLEAALPSGELLDELGRIRKNNAGLALRQLFIGSEGTLGIITRVALDLVPVCGTRRVALALFRDLDQAIRLMRRIERRATECTGGSLVAAELMSGNQFALTARALAIAPLVALAPAAFALLLGVAAADDASAAALLESVLGEAAEEDLIIDAVLPKNAAEERELWRVREDWAVDRAHPGGLWYDVSVPLEGIADYLRSVEARLARHDPSLSVYVVGHLADGNLHFTINAAQPISERYAEIAPLVYEGLKAIGGSFSAEHGIGLEKRASLITWSGDTRMRLMRAVKAVFDPEGIMNPGKMLAR